MPAGSESTVAGALRARVTLPPVRVMAGAAFAGSPLVLTATRPTWAAYATVAGAAVSDAATCTVTVSASGR